MLDNRFSLNSKTAFVTGASSGLGAHFAKVLAAAGAHVVLGARRLERLDELSREISNSGGKALPVELDVTSDESVRSAFEMAELEFGPINTVINNAGVASPKRFIDVGEDDYDFIMDTNLKGVWRVASVAARRLIAKGLGGSFVNISSVLGIRVDVGNSIYSAAKAGVIQMTKSMALEFAGKSIRVNALCPGYFRTEINSDYFESDKGRSFIKGTPAGRLGEMQELDGALLLLASDAGSFINGAAIPIDGGHLVSSL